MTRRRLLPDVLIALIVAAPAAAQPHTATPIRLEPCTLTGIEHPVRCGTVEVFENRAARSGRKIPLFVAVLPALDSARRLNDPLFVLAGGPGQAPSEMRDFIDAAFGKIHQRRDIVLADPRGTGRSRALRCGLYASSGDMFGDFYPPAAVRACRDSLSRIADLRQYTTPAIMDDLDDVRAALGYDRINIYGTSYGTRAALVYLRQHPTRVRSAVLKSVAPTTMRAPMSYARDGERALRYLFDDCAADAPCHAAYPALEREFAELLARADRHELSAAIASAAAGAGGPTTVTISRGALASTVMGILQSVHSTAQLPLAIQQAYTGDASFIAQAIVASRRAVAQQLALGMHLTVMCSEDTPLLDPARAAREGAGTFLGDYRVRQQIAACEAWVRGEVPRDYAEPVRSDVPVLLISGILDPNTNEQWANEAARTLPNATQVVFRNVAHAFSAVQGCGDAIMAGFVDRASAAGLDLSCVDQVRRPPFLIR